MWCQIFSDSMFLWLVVSQAIVAKTSSGWTRLLLAFSLAIGAMTSTQNAYGQDMGVLPSQEVLTPVNEVSPLATKLQDRASDAPIPTGCDDTAPANNDGASQKKDPPKFKSFLFENNFSYLEDPDNEYRYLGDAFKRQRLGDDITYDLGGEERLRYHHESTFVRHDDFLLNRTRLFANFQVQDWFRVYTEAIDADEIGNRHKYRMSEVNRFDALNLFADGKLLTEDQGDLWLRGGRQQMVYGNNRLIGTRDWYNTGYTYDGAKLFWRGKDWDVDGFWTHPVTLSQHANPDQTFDAPDGDRELAGIYSTYRGIEHQIFDYYYIRYTDCSTSSFQYNTFGFRWKGDMDSWLWEIESGYQCGSTKDTPQSAWFYVLGAGRKFEDLPWEPTFWVYYNSFSGDRNPNDGVSNTFNQLVSTTVTFLGWAALFGNSNIEDLNFRFSMKPHPKVTVEEGLHLFYLESANDALYDSQGNALRRDPTGAAGNVVGQELDTTVRWSINPRTELFAGYCHFFPGHFLAATSGGSASMITSGSGGNAQDFVFTQFSLKF